MNSAHDSNDRDVLGENVKFDNISFTGSLNSNPENYKTINSYENLTHYVMNDGSELFAVETDDAILYIVYQDGVYNYSYSKHKHAHAHENTLPLITRDDITILANGTLVISDSYMKSLYRAWIESDIQSTWYFGDMTLSYAGLLSYFDSSTFDTTVTWVDGKMTEYHISLINYTTVFYSLDFVTTDAKTMVDMTMHRIFRSNFVYVKGANSYATLDAYYENSTTSMDYHARVDVITGLTDFVYSEELLAAIEVATDKANLEQAISQKYNGMFTANDDCTYLMIYDTEYNVYVVFYNTGSGYAAISLMANDQVERYTGCTATVNLTNKTLTAIQHCDAEVMNTIIGEKYAGVYTVTPDGEYEGILVYDSEYDSYIVFLQDSNGWKYLGYISSKDMNGEVEEFLSQIPRATINTETKVITIIQ